MTKLKSFWSFRKRIPSTFVMVSLLYACSRYIDAVEVESLITQGFPQRTGLNVVDVSCPPKEPIEKDVTFQCTVTLEDGPTLEVNVTQQDSDGNVLWDETDGVKTLEGVIDNEFLAQEISDGIFKQTAIQVKTDCGRQLRLSQKGDMFRCTTIDAQNNQREIRVTVEDNAGKVSWGL